LRNIPVFFILSLPGPMEPVSQGLGKCVNDVNKSSNCVKILSLKDCTFVSELLYGTKKLYGITKGSAFIKYYIPNI